MKRVQSLTLATLVGFVGCYGGDSPDTAISVYDVNRNPTVQEPAASDTEEAAEAESTPAPPAVADPDADRPPSVSPPAPQEVVEATPPVINQPVRVNEEPAPSVPPQEQTTNEEAVGEPATSEPNRHCREAFRKQSVCRLGKPCQLGETAGHVWRKGNITHPMRRASSTVSDENGSNAAPACHLAKSHQRQ